MSRYDTLARLRAYAITHPTDVKAVVDAVRTADELDALAVLAKLAAAWASGRSRAQRLHLLASYGVDVTDCRCSDLRRAIKREKMRRTFDEALERSMTATRRGIGNPGLKAKLEARREEPFLLERVKRLPAPPPPPSSPVSVVRALTQPVTDAVGRVAQYFREARKTDGPLDSETPHASGAWPSSR